MQLKNQGPVASLFLSPGIFVCFSRHKKMSDVTLFKCLWLVPILHMH